MFKKGLSVLVTAAIFFTGLNPTHAVRSEQLGNTSVFEYCNTDDIKRTVDALWKVYDCLPDSAEIISPKDTVHYIGQILLESGVGREVTRNGTTECGVIVSAILQRCDALAGVKTDFDTLSTIRWFKPTARKNIRAGIYKFIEEFKKAGYVQGDNNYVALVFEGDLITGTIDPIELSLMGNVSIDSKRNWFNHHCDQITKFIAGVL